MQQAPRPSDEHERLHALRSIGLLDSAPEARFDRLTRLVCRLLDVPTALVSLVDDERQWFKSCQNLSATELPRDSSFCGHAICEEEILYVADAREDPRFADNPLVIGEPFIRFYAGIAVQSHGGHRLGTLCAIDYRPRELSREQLQDLEDLAALVEREIQASELAVTDDLTGLPNRRGFAALAENGLAHCRRHAIASCLLYIDLDNFKAINDARGHTAGDSVLQEFARCLQQSIRETDVCGRIGGDEFVVLLTGRESTDPESFVQRLRDAIDDREKLRAHAGDALRWSYGVVCCEPGRHASVEHLLAEADRSMYDRKRERAASD